jgi:ADP-ribose pyrophosphatase
VSTKTVFKGRLITLKTQKKKLPNGYVAHLEVVTHPGAALIVPFLDKNKIIMLRQYRPVIDSYIYELPAGTLEKREKPINCAKREIIEETSYSAARFTKLGDIFPVPGYSTEKISIYKAEGLTKKDVSPEADEVIKCVVFTKNGIQRLLKRGKLVDAKTICALAMCGWIK